MSTLRKIQHLVNKDGTYYGSRWITTNRYGVTDYGNDRIFNIYKCRRTDRLNLIESYEKHLDVVRYTKNADDLGKIKFVEIPVEYATTGTIENKTKKFINPNDIHSFSTQDSTGFRFNLPEPKFDRSGSRRLVTAQNMSVYNIGSVHYVPKMNRPAAYRGNIDISQEQFDSNSVYCHISFNKVRQRVSETISVINSHRVNKNLESGAAHKNAVSDLAEILAKYAVINYYICSSWDSFDEHWDIRTINYSTCWELAKRILMESNVFDKNLEQINVTYNYLYYRFCKKVKDILGYDLGTFSSWLKYNVNLWCDYSHDVNRFPENYDSSLKRDFVKRFPTEKTAQKNLRNQEIIAMYIDGKKQIDIASETGMSYPQIRRIIKEYRSSLLKSENIEPEGSTKMITFSETENCATDSENIEPEGSTKMSLFSGAETPAPKPSKPGLCPKLNLSSKLDGLDLGLTSNSFKVSEVPNETKTIKKQVKSADGTKGLW